MLRPTCESQRWDDSGLYYSPYLFPNLLHAYCRPDARTEATYSQQIRSLSTIANKRRFHRKLYLPQTRHNAFLPQPRSTPRRECSFGSIRCRKKGAHRPPGHSQNSPQSPRLDQERRRLLSPLRGNGQPNPTLFHNHYLSKTYHRNRPILPRQ